MHPPRGKPLALTTAALALAVVGVAAWLSWPHVRFWWLFEPLGRNAQGYLEYRHRQTGIVMVALPGGRFLMGAQKEDPNEPNYDPVGDGSESPVHEVQLSPFLIAKYELTVAEWGAVMGANPSHSNANNLPVSEVSWEGCREFCRRTGLHLPTEAQWEYACRGGSRGAFCFGSDSSSLGEYAWFENNGGGAPHPVGQKRPNSFGIHDMHGNITEWCQDVWDFGFYRKPEAIQVDPVNVSELGEKVARGGSYDCESDISRAASRWRRGHDVRMPEIGFRPTYGPLP